MELTGRLTACRLLGWRLTSDGPQQTNRLTCKLGAWKSTLNWPSVPHKSQPVLVTVAGHAAQQAVKRGVEWVCRTDPRFTNYSPTRNGATPAWDLQYTFDFSPSQVVSFDNGTEPDPITVNKAGQHLLDVCTEYKEQAGPDGWFLPSIVRAATHKIRPEINYTTELGI